jgi:2-amino-4-hydroxy-6-hydroxymethyldihydropteridine diphosphokinase
MNNHIFLLLGSNQDDPAENLRFAAHKIDVDAGKILDSSSLYKTAAWGLKDQPDFFNQVLRIRSGYTPQRLLRILLDIERDMGRVRAQKWGPRIIDIDILFYGTQMLDSPSLKIPHPGIPERRFTLVPLTEIAADWLHPGNHKSMSQLLAECKDTLPVQKIVP